MSLFVLFDKSPNNTLIDQSCDIVFEYFMQSNIEVRDIHLLKVLSEPYPPTNMGLWPYWLV